MEFRYIAYDRRGMRISAHTHADSIAALVGGLKNQGLTPLKIKKIGVNGNTKHKQPTASRKVKFNELLILTRQLASAINSGLILTESLETISYDSENRYLGYVLKDLVKQIHEGSSFSNALTKYPKVFSDGYIALIKAGEESGGLATSLNELTKYLEAALKLRQKINEATRYPIVLISLFAVVVSLIVFFIIPKFKAVFSQFNFQLPLLTRIVVGISEFALRNVLWLILTVVTFSVSFIVLVRLDSFRLIFDRFKLKFFLLGKITKKIWITRFCRTLSMLLSGGVNLISGLTISAEVPNNLYLKKVIADIKESVLSGTTLSQAFKDQEVFPVMLVKMMQVGEKTGKLNDMLSYNADYYDKELDATLDALTSYLEPALIIFIGIIVGVTVISFYLPIFKLSQIVK